MDFREASYQYRETRLNLEPSSPASIVDVYLSDRGANGRPSHRRNNTADTAISEDGDGYRLKRLAAASSIFHRTHHHSPKSFLWRVLDDDKVLSIRVVDVYRENDKSADANIILHLHFASPIRPSCVALADPVEHDALCIFVLDQANHLHSLTLRPDFFRRRSAGEAGLGDACRTYRSNVFGFKHPHRMVAPSSDQVLVTFHDGGLLKLDKNKTHDAAALLFKETQYNSAGWGKTLRGMISFGGKHTIRHGKIHMELAAATSLATTSMGFDDTSYLFTVCLDHCIRVWNIRTGQILYAGDLLNAEHDPQEIGKWTVDPSHTNLLRIYGEQEGVRQFVTYSPVGAGQFKFWTAMSGEQDRLEVMDAYPRYEFVPPPPSKSDVWTLADFQVAPRDPRHVDLWVLWKNNMAYRVQRVTLNNDNPKSSWKNGWSTVHSITSIPPAQESGPCDPVDPTERWLQLILFPGRFARSTLEAALGLYERNLGIARDPSRSVKGLTESICSVIGSTAVLDKTSHGTMDYDQFRYTSDTHWRRFYRLLLELDKQRGEALSLTLDADQGMAWVTCSDILGAIRDCSAVDQLCQNSALSTPPQKNTKFLIAAGLAFMEGFNDGMVQSSTSALRAELFEESSKTDLERIQYFSDKAGFWRQITDDDCANVTDTLGPTFNIITMPLYQDLMQLVTSGDDLRGRVVRHPCTEFGRKLIVKAVQETADLYWKVFCSQLILLVHMENESGDDEDNALHKRLDIGRVFRQLLVILKRLELVRYLARAEINVRSSKMDRSNSTSASPSSSRNGIQEDTLTITAFEGTIGHLLGLSDIDEQSLATSVTDLVASICAPDSDIELSPYLIQCSLLKQDRPDLALELGPFCDQDPMSTYVQGRVFLALNDFDSAAAYFKKAAIGMSMPVRHVDRHSAGLLDDTEWKLLNSGLANYYAHIVALYDRPKAWSFVIDFARLALQFARRPTGNDVSARLHSDLLNRLFTATTELARFDEAHATLLLMTDTAVQQSGLRKLVTTMCEASHTAELIALPFAGLQDAVDEILLQKCHGAHNVVDGVPYHQILYGWRVRRGQFRGAAAVLLDRLHKLQLAGEGDKLSGEDALDTPVTRQFLMLINALSCVDAKQAWVFLEEGAGQAERAGKRKVVTLADIRKQYQNELDRIAAIQNNQFGFGEGDEMEL